MGNCSQRAVSDGGGSVTVIATDSRNIMEEYYKSRRCSSLPITREKTLGYLVRQATIEIVEVYVTKKAAMKKIIENNKQRLSLTTDIRKLIISFKHVEDHKGQTICDTLMACLAEWSIKRIFCITVDNSTANSTAMTKFKKEMLRVYGSEALILKGEYLHLRCATHILNLVVKEGLTEIDSCVAAIRNGITYVRSSTHRLKSFDFRVETGKLQRGSLPLDVKTRWNSTYLMLDQALKFRIAFERMEAEDKPYNDYFLEKEDGKKRIGPAVRDDWEKVDRLVQILEIFYKSTLVLSASNYVAAHKLYNEIVSITRNLGALRYNDDALKNKAEAMLAKLGKYWDAFGEKVEMNRLVIVASVFDPRKKMKFAELCFERLYGKGTVEATHLSDSVYGIITDLYDEYTRNSLANNTGSGSSTTGLSTQSENAWSQSQSQSQDKGVSDFSERPVLRNGFLYYL
ncbi:unnamed protein product [Arabidopsis arenosa]|uniref:hAT-like transposase RNase-H fold domain-containing protein n=1 Tax=Arabidopsis arenosa TaxID=38785 RepID=A0A8S2AX14_ARAAE|nr:unnamed protein product [Arabidopsis arenosa]